MNTGWKKWVSVIGAIVISGWFLWVTVHGINWARLLEILSGTKTGWVLVGSAAFTLSYAIKWWRWHLILKGLAPDIVPKQTLAPFFGGFALAILLLVLFYAVSALFGSLGAIHVLPPLLAAWSSGLIFVILGLFFFTRVNT